MSQGTKSEVFAPVKKEMLELFERKFHNIQPVFIREIFSIMTEKLVTETLLFTAILSMVSRFLRGEYEDETAYGHFGAGTKLSAVTKDGKRKMQTRPMELLHDVIVELQMAGGNFRKLQKYLASHGLSLVCLHSCYMLVIRVDNVDAFYEACGTDQQRRTELDWVGTTLKNVSLEMILEETEYTMREAQIAEECYKIALEAVYTVYTESELVAVT
jgi:hypothetical protein